MYCCRFAHKTLFPSAFPDCRKDFEATLNPIKTQKIINNFPISKNHTTFVKMKPKFIHIVRALDGKRNLLNTNILPPPRIGANFLIYTDFDAFGCAGGLLLCARCELVIHNS